MSSAIKTGRIRLIVWGKTYSAVWNAYFSDRGREFHSMVAADFS